MRIGITGSSGLIGTALSTHLKSVGHGVTPIVRGRPGDDELGWNPAAGQLDPGALTGLDAIVHLAGAGIGDHRWTDDYRATLIDSRVGSTELLAETMADAGGPGVLISASAIGYYGDRGDEQLDESSSGGDGFLAEICRRWETATASAETAGVRVAHMRTGIVLTPAGGALKKMLPLFRLGLGGRFGPGRQWMSWISIDDQVRAIEHLLSSSLNGPVNLTAPQPVRNSEFAAALGAALKRPSFLPVPTFGPKLVFGSERAEALLFGSQRVAPAALLGDGFEFDHPDIATGLTAVLRT